MAVTTTVKPAPANPKPVKSPAPWIVLGGVLVLGIGLALGYVLFKSEDQAGPNTNTVVNRANRNINSSNSNLVVNSSLNANEAVVNINATNTNSEPTNTNASQPVVPDGLTLIDTPTIFVSGLTNNMVEVYDAGVLADSKYQGEHLLLFEVTPEGPYFQPYFYRVIKEGTKYTLIVLQSDDPTGQLDPAKYTTDADTIIPSLDYPTIIQGPEARQTLELVPGVNALFNDTDLTKVFTDSEFGPVYTNRLDPDYTITPYAFRLNGYYLQAPDHTVRTYKLKLDFIGNDGVPIINWSDSTNGTRNYYQYNFTDMAGCGVTNYANVVSTAEVSIANDLKSVGTSIKGDTIYELKNTEHALLKNMYDQYGPQYGGEKESYATFIQNHPMIFFVDAFDRLVKGQRSDYAPLAECGKPVIYLYPQQTTDVSVKVAPSGGFSQTEPVYDDGWNVTATPTGQLTEIATGAAYPYLFWEGRSQTVYPETNRGFVVDQAEVHGFLVDKLAKLGLNGKETADFIEFWEPRMQGAPYYFVTFLGKREMDQLAPLTVTPKPDTVIRILMDFKPLQAPIAVQGYDIHTPERKGFTVVEWGGVLR